MVHRFTNNGYNIVMDINSGAIHVVDPVTYDLIGLYKELSPDEVRKQTGELHPEISTEEIAQIYDEVRELEISGDLFTPDPYEEKVKDYTKRPTVVKALCLHVAHDCNLACKYCFAEEGEYHGGHRELMSLEVGKAALDFLIENSGSRHNLEVDFFGGEPLMNWDVVKQLVHYGRSREEETGKHFRFTLTTNGVLLSDEVIDFANKEMDNIVLSIDGRKELNDKMRPFRGGKESTYERIVPRFQKVAESRNQERYYARGTFTRYNKDFANDVLHLADLGFKQISVEPVVAHETDDYAIRPEDVPDLLNEYDRLAGEMLQRMGTDKDFNFFHFMIDLEGGPCVYKRLSGCGSGTEYLAVTPTGELYPCHQFVGETEFMLGDVFTGVKKTDIVQKFKGANVYSRPACRDCFAKYYCSGGCAANAYNFTGDILGNYEVGCQLQRKRVECAIMLKAAAQSDGPDSDN
ncbi:MAG: thioether cross-link-forming SCIFF peptide maturase [Lachnospiraceae bacterium]|nr:thioether cross-link-forming SCIFF peptide maturase [Lachnospiraceae bacterium]